MTITIDGVTRELSQEDIPALLSALRPTNNDDEGSLDFEGTINALQYIAMSPPHEHGGFHPNAVKAARSAIHHLEEMQARLERVRKFGQVYIYPSDWNCWKMGEAPPIEAYEKIDLSDA